MDKITIVTICYNNLEELLLTCKHIDLQSVKPYEHIIIDGSTKSDIRDHLASTEHPPYRTWLSEPDKGISDAWNKGILRSNGDIIHIQNSGDYYYDNNILEVVQDAFYKNPQARWLHGKYAQYKGDMWVISGKIFEREKLYRGFRTIGHPTMFVRNELYKKHGLFDLTIKIVMDYDFLVRIADEPFIFLDRPLAVFAPGGQSNNFVDKSVNEMIKVYTHYHGYSLKNKAWGLRIRLIDQLTNTNIGKQLFRLKNIARKPVKDTLVDPTGKRTPGKLNDAITD